MNVDFLCEVGEVCGEYAGKGLGLRHGFHLCKWASSTWRMHADVETEQHVKKGMDPGALPKTRAVRKNPRPRDPGGHFKTRPAPQSF